MRRLPNGLPGSALNPGATLCTFLDVAMYVLDYAKDKNYLVHDLIDVQHDLHAMDLR